MRSDEHGGAQKTKNTVCDYNAYVKSCNMYLANMAQTGPLCECHCAKDKRLRSFEDNERQSASP